jgi:phosphoglycolate phosphatase-like HAD superfamily hydrolase
LVYIFDIDGTLSNPAHRLHYILNKPKDWPEFFAACKDDEPIQDVVNLAIELYNADHEIFLITGRSDECEEATIDWLFNHDIGYKALYMRKAGDHREDNIVKSELLDQLLQDWDEKTVDGIFEDRQQVVDMYRARGLRVYQVAKGDF